MCFMLSCSVVFTDSKSFWPLLSSNCSNSKLVYVQIEQKVRDTRKLMEIAAKDLNFVEAASLRDKIKALKEQL